MTRNKLRITFRKGCLWDSNENRLLTMCVELRQSETIAVVPFGIRMVRQCSASLLEVNANSLCVLNVILQLGTIKASLYVYPMLTQKESDIPTYLILRFGKQMAPSRFTR